MDITETNFIWILKQKKFLISIGLKVQILNEENTTHCVASAAKKAPIFLGHFYLCFGFSISIRLLYLEDCRDTQKKNTKYLQPQNCIQLIKCPACVAKLPKPLTQLNLLQSKKYLNYLILFHLFTCTPVMIQHFSIQLGLNLV